MNQGTSIAFLVIGIVLLVFGFSAYHSASSQVSRFFTGAPTGKALWLLVGGVGVSIIGVLGLMKA